VEHIGMTDSPEMSFNIRSSQKAIGFVTMSSTASLDLRCSPIKKRRRAPCVVFGGRLYAGTGNIHWPE
jgi:hypothetical protein